MGHTEQGKFPCIKLREFRQHEFHATSLESIVHLFEADDCHGGAGDHDEDAEDEEEVEDLVAEGAVREAPVRHLRKQEENPSNEPAAEATNLLLSIIHSNAL